MAGITAEGFVIKTLPEIIASLNAKYQAEYGDSFSVATNTPEGFIIGIMADEISDAWEGAQGVYDASFPKTSYGLNLDNVSDIVNVRRIPAANSTALLQVTGTVGSLVVADTVVTVTTTNSRFLVASNLTLQSTQFSDVTIEVTAVADTTDYEITINGTLASITSDGTATADEIVASLKVAIDALSLGVTVTLPTSSTLRINVTEPSSVLPLVVGARLGITSISDLVTVVAEDTGVIKAPVNTLNTLLVPIAGITSVTNLVAAVEGRVEETDEELRVRRYESVQIIGASTEQAIRSNVRNLDGVTAAFVITNRTFEIDVDGRPPKSFEVVVEGGDEQEIGQTIWDFHPVGIESTGDITKTVQDSDGTDQTVLFSRPVQIYIRMEIDYTKYSEEAFAATGEDGIKQAALAYGSSLNIGVDVIPPRFFGSIYSSVAGIESLAVRISSSTDLITWTPYSTSPTAVGRKERSQFDITRIVVNEV
jgi:uncharacterized phage protein gp47/JayE